MNKLAELILKKHMEGSQWYAPVCDSRVLAAMQEYAEAYHEAKLAEITDEDIEAWANNRWVDSLMISATDVITGAMSFRDGEIKHIEK